MIPLEPGEKILMEVRKHWLTIAVHGLVLVILALIPLLVAPFVMQYMFFDYVSSLNVNVLGSMYFFGAAAWLWFVWTMFFVAWTNYYLDVVVITNKRLVDMEQFVLFSRDEVVIPLNSVEDVKIEVLGFIATLFNFGNLQIQSAGAARETIATKIRKPEKVLACLGSALEHKNTGI